MLPSILWIRWISWMILLTSGAVLAALAAAPPEPMEITGHVTDEDGVPLAGARVALYPAISPSERAVLWLAGRQYPEPSARTLTGADGGYRLVVPDSGGLLWTVVAGTEGHVPMEREVGPLFDSTFLETVHLVARVPTSVRVVGPEGESVPGAAVLLRISPQARRITQGGDSWHPPVARVAHTGEDGRAELARADGEYGWLQAVAPGRLAVTELAAARTEIALPAAAGRSLRVVDADGQPAAGALAWWAPDGLPAVGKRVRESLPVARYRLVPVAAAGDDGALRLPGGLPESPVVRLAAPDGAWGSPPPAEPEAAPGTSTEARLRPPVTLAGTVRERESEKAVPGAVVWADSDRSAVAQTDGKGRFRLALPGPEATLVSTAGPRHGPATPGTAVYGESASGVVLEVEPALALAGRVESADGAALEGATIVAQPSVKTLPDRGSECGRARVLSGLGGRFRLPRLTPHCDYHLEAWREGFAAARLDVAPLADDESGYEPVTLVLGVGRTLAGRVVDPDGVPVPGARVQFYRYTPWLQYASFPLMETREPVALADGAGLFEIEHLAGARGHVVAEADGFVRFERGRVEVPDEPGKTDLGDLELEPERFLEIEVVDADDRPVEGAEVSVRRYEGDELFGSGDQVTDSHSRTDGAGRFRVGGFAARDRAMLLVRKEGFVSESLQNLRIPSDSPVRVALKQESVVTGRVVDASGRPVTEARVSTKEWEWNARSADRLPLAARVDDEGRFELDKLPAGPIRMRALGPEGGRSDVLRLELAAGERRDGVELVLRARPRILGRVVAPDGSPVSDAEVTVRGSGGPGDCRTGEDGGFRCEGWDPGTYTLTARKAGVGLVTESVVLGDADVTVDLYLEPELVISGRIVTAEGEPVADRVVRVLQPAAGFSDSLTERTAADGSFTIRGVPEGTYDLLVGSRSDPTGLLAPYRYPEPIVVRDGLSVTGLEVRLEVTTVLRGVLHGLSEGEVARAMVAAQKAGAEGLPFMLGGEVGEGGRYEIEGIGPGVWTVMAVGPKRIAQARAEIEILPGEEDPVLDLTLVRGVTLAGRVLLGGKPWAGAMVGMFEAAGMTTTDLGGRFELPGIPAGRQQILLAGGSLEEGMTLVTREVDVEEGQEVVIDVAVGRVRGLVTGPDGPLAGTRVTLSPVIPGLPDNLPLIPRSATTAPDGRFMIDRVAAGSYVITFQKPGYRPITQELQVTGGEIELPPMIVEPEDP